MKIDCIYIACYKDDVRMARILAMSIRKWYPSIPIKLIKDELNGTFDTSEFEKVLNVSVLHTHTNAFGWCMGKFEPYFLSNRHRCLILDADMIFLGPVLDELENYDEDFVVRLEDPPDLDFINRLYFDLEKLKQFDPTFAVPSFTFNGGGIVATTGILKRSDFDNFVAWTTPPQFTRPDLFKCGDQGVLNYVLMKKSAEGEISLARCNFMDFPYTPSGMAVELSKISQTSPYKFLLHWAGRSFKNTVAPNFDGSPRADLLLHFEKMYYDLIPLRALKYWVRLRLAALRSRVKSLVKRIPGLVAARKILKDFLLRAGSERPDTSRGGTGHHRAIDPTSCNRRPDHHIVCNEPARRYDMRGELLPDGCVAVHSQTDNQVHTLSPLAGLIWEFCDGKHSLVQIVDKVSAASGIDISSEQAARLLNELGDAGLLLTDPTSMSANSDGIDLSQTSVTQRAPNS
jgi:Coenzyme PQQ synthesis protein D (PqqD)